MRGFEKRLFFLNMTENTFKLKLNSVVKPLNALYHSESKAGRAAIMTILLLDLR